MSGFDDPLVAKIIAGARMGAAMHPFGRWDAVRQAIQVEIANAPGKIIPPDPIYDLLNDPQYRPDASKPAPRAE